MESLKLALLSLAATLGYGVALDEAAIRVCPEYFTLAHKPLFASDSLTLIALAWGLISTWWIGLALGILLPLAARAGRGRKFVWTQLIRPFATVLIVTALTSVAIGILGWWMSGTGRLLSAQPWALQLPFPRQNLFIAVLWAHAFSYFSGSLGGLAVIAWVLWRRFNPAAPAVTAEEAHSKN